MYPLTVKKAKGCYVYDEKNTPYLDFTSSIFTANVGHGNKAVLKAIKRAINKPLIHAYGFNTIEKENYIRALREYSGNREVFLCSTGSESIEWAIQLVQKWNELNKIKGTIYGLKGGFHGKTLGSRALVNDLPEVVGIKPLKFLPDDMAGLFIETYQGWSGRFHDAEYIGQLCRICKQRNILVVFDEMQSGFGRTGRFWGYNWYGVEPDIICCGKAMGGGYPLSAVLAKAEIMDLGSDMSTTHSGNPLSCTVGLAVLKEIERQRLVERSYNMGLGLHTYLLNLSGRHDIEVNGYGLMAGVIFPDKDRADAVCEYCFMNRLLVVKTGKSGVKLAPPLTITENELIKGLNIFKEAVAGVFT